MMARRAEASHCLPVADWYTLNPSADLIVLCEPRAVVAEGGMLEVIEDGKNGVLLKSDFTIDDIILAVKNTTSDVAKKMEEECLRTAEKFTEEKFVEGIEKVIY
jgi:glycosyltransferase involved in cell wall biosynthesis